jgi:hypothetical protein
MHRIVRNARRRRRLMPSADRYASHYFAAPAARPSIPGASSKYL